MTEPTRRPVLGRGLSALIPDAGLVPSPGPAGTSFPVPLSRVRPADRQPRTEFDDRAVEELSLSIRENGIIQPIVVREVEPGDYVIIAGERRWRAAARAGLQVIPVVVREETESSAYQLALIENIQREDLRPLEEAEAYRHLLEAKGLTQEALASRVGKDRATIANSLRLLRLPAELKAALASGVLSPGHIRALLTVPDETAQLSLAVRAEVEGWSVRETERNARQQRAEPIEPPAAALDEAEGPTETVAPRRPDQVALEDQLRGALGAAVRLAERGGRGRIEIRFHSREDLDRLVELLLSLEGR